ncbi:hypothetical protein Mal4_23510 [Maioricimonas rarisocia]|uniref:Secreted protein n=1 Tax=Maioricimonas rarisocia TaxID=2528026 RepID=A0A517Z6J1_9PLAN|nr:hypothetical protein [Maioricimonas rarisocia]QDU38031.1 hypothetical protein Mal4_23510 [Maioricimonas rarisocia]
MFRLLSILPMIAAVLACPLVCAEVPAVIGDSESDVVVSKGCCGGCQEESESPQRPEEDCQNCACIGFLEAPGTFIHDMGTVAPADVVVDAAIRVSGVECSVASRARPPGRLLMPDSHGALALRLAVASLTL